MSTIVSNPNDECNKENVVPTVEIEEIENPIIIEAKLQELARSKGIKLFSTNNKEEEFRPGVTRCRWSNKTTKLKCKNKVQRKDAYGLCTIHHTLLEKEGVFVKGVFDKGVFVISEPSKQENETIDASMSMSICC